MKKNIKKTIISLGIVIVVLGNTGSFTEPGSDRDPLITKSYVDEKIEEIKLFVSDNFSENKNNTVNTSSNELKIVELAKDESIILDKGSEAILRSGSAKAISKVTNGIDNGLSNITIGEDLKTNQDIERDHLLLSPRGDGRGAKASSDSIFLVRGVYEIR